MGGLDNDGLGPSYISEAIGVNSIQVKLFDSYPALRFGDYHIR